MTGFGVILPWKEGFLMHGGVHRPTSTDPKSALLHIVTWDSKNASNGDDLGKDCQPVPLSHHAGCLIKVLFDQLAVNGVSLLGSNFVDVCHSNLLISTTLNIHLSVHLGSKGWRPTGNYLNY